MSNRDVNPGQGFHATPQQLEWSTEDRYWRDNWRARPYASSDRDYAYYEPGYRYGTEAARTHRGKRWEEVEDRLREGWERFEHRGEASWEHMKGPARDAWDRVRGKG